MTQAPSLLQVSQAAALAEQIAQAQDAYKQWEAHLKQLKLQLMELHDAGVVPSDFEAAGFSFKLQQGRTSVVLDDEAKAQIADIQQAALASGHAVTKQGDPFWTLKAVKA